MTLEPGIASREGGHVYEGVSGTLRANAGDNQMAVAYGISSFDSNAMKSSNPHSGIYAASTSRTLDLNGGNPTCNQGGIAIVERLVLDDQGGQQINVRTDGKSPTLRAEMHGNIPAVMEPQTVDFGRTADRIYINPKTSVTLSAQGGGMGAKTGLYCIPQDPVYCLQGNGIDRADTAGCNGKGWKEDTSYTLNTIDRPAVVYCTDVGQFNTAEDLAPPLLARTYKDPHLVGYSGNEIRYIVRRLTPTECARLQGFADRWGDIDKKDSFTPEEYRFWLEVRNTHAAINGKQVKDYTEAQMLTWYNKLHTDSAEYKMWGNGIALPPALYCLQGIVAVLESEEEDWLL